MSFRKCERRRQLSVIRTAVCARLRGGETVCYYHRGTRLNAMKSFCPYRLCSHLNVLTISPKRGGRPATSWVDCLQKNLEAFGAVPRKGKGRKWVAFGVVVKDGRDWMTAAKNMDKWHRGVERGAEALDSAWRRADLRQSNVQLQR